MCSMSIQVQLQIRNFGGINFDGVQVLFILVANQLDRIAILRGGNGLCKRSELLPVVADLGNGLDERHGITDGLEQPTFRSGHALLIVDHINRVTLLISCNSLIQRLVVVVANPRGWLVNERIGTC